MSRYQHLMFVCQKERPADNPKGCCAHKGSAELLGRLKMLMATHGLQGKVRFTDSGCLDHCANGVTVFVFSPGAEHPETWYEGLTPADAEELFEQHVIQGKRLTRCVMSQS